MADLILVATFLITLILIVRVIVKLIQKKNTKSTLLFLTIVWVSYLSLWIAFYVASSEEILPLNTDICFDDWCATVTKFEKQTSIGLTKPRGQFVVLHIKMSNHARGIAQKPSEPRINILADDNSYGISDEGQNALESISGKQNPLDARLELHESLETILVFDVPVSAANLRVHIDEGPLFINTLILHGNKRVFLIE